MKIYSESEEVTTEPVTTTEPVITTEPVTTIEPVTSAEKNTEKGTSSDITTEPETTTTIKGLGMIFQRESAHCPIHSYCTATVPN